MTSQPNGELRQPGTPRSGTPQPGTPRSGTPRSGTPQPGTPQPGTPRSGTPQSGKTPQLGMPQPPARRGNHARLLIGMVIGALVAVFAFLNLGDVKVDWIFGSNRSPLIVVIAVSFLLGMLVTRLGLRRRAKRSSREARTARTPAREESKP